MILQVRSAPQSDDVRKKGTQGHAGLRQHQSGGGDESDDRLTRYGFFVSPKCRLRSDLIMNKEDLHNQNNYHVDQREFLLVTKVF